MKDLGDLRHPVTATVEAGAPKVRGKKKGTSMLSGNGRGAVAEAEIVKANMTDVDMDEEQARHMTHISPKTEFILKGAEEAMVDNSGITSTGWKGMCPVFSNNCEY